MTVLVHAVNLCRFPLPRSVSLVASSSTSRGRRQGQHRQCFEKYICFFFRLASVVIRFGKLFVRSLFFPFLFFSPKLVCVARFHEVQAPVIERAPFSFDSQSEEISEENVPELTRTRPVIG